MWRQILHNSTFVLIGAVFLHGLNTISLDYLTSSDSKFEENHSQIIAEAGKVEAITAHHSANVAIDFDALGLNGYQMTIGGSDIFETKFLLENLLPKASDLKYVFMAVGVTDFWLDHNLGKVDSRRHFYRIMHDFGSDTYIEGDWKNHFMGLNFALVRGDYWSEAFKKIGVMLGLSSRADVDPAFRRKQLKNVEVSAQKLERLALSRVVKGQLPFVKAALKEDPQIADRVEAALIGIHSFAKEHDVRLIYYTPPGCLAYLEAISRDAPEFVAEFKARMKELQNEHGVEYYDYSYDEDISPYAKYYADEVHLKKSGAAIFSTKLRKEIDRSKHSK